MTVSNPATLSSANAEFSGNGTLTALVRGGSYVAIGNSSTIATSAGLLALSQFNGVTKVSSLSATLSPTTVSGSGQGTQGSGAVTSAAMTCNPVGGSGTYSYTWSVTAQFSVTSGSCSTPNAKSTTFYGITSGGTMSVQCVVNDGSTSYTASGGQVNLSWTQVACVVEEAFMFDGRQARDVEAGDSMRSTNPWGRITQMRDVRVALSAEAECYRVVTSSGASLTVTETAPFPVLKCDKCVTTLGLYGHYIPVSRDMGSDQPSFMWEQVVDIIPVGKRRIRPLDINDNCFWASDDNRSFILTHNKALIP